MEDEEQPAAVSPTEQVQVLVFGSYASTTLLLLQ
jgi:hypothetical protein